MVWTRSPRDWMLKAVGFGMGGTNCQAGPRNLLFTYKICQKGVLLPAALKSTNQHEKYHQINRCLTIDPKSSALNPL